MHLSNQFPELFRKEQYAVEIALMDDKDLQDVISDELLAHEPIDGVYNKDYSLIPIGSLAGRGEAEHIPEKTMAVGFETFGAIAIEASVKMGLSKTMEQRSKQFVSNGRLDESAFAGHLADTFGRSVALRQKQKWQKLSAALFNLGGIPGGHLFFNHRLRVGGLADVPNIQTIYDGCPLFVPPTNAHPAASDGSLLGPTSMPVGITTDFAGAIADTGGYFNAFQLPPSYWALKRVIQHFKFNMQFDDNNERYQYSPDTLFVSSYNLPRWIEILRSHYIEPTAAGSQTNRENVFMVEGFKLNLVDSPYLIGNTWGVGKAKSRAIRILDPSQTEEPWAYYRDEDNRIYYCSYEKEWGFHICNWRAWCMGAYSVDGVTPPHFGAEATWDQIPAGV